jgi:hypothetical protein
VTERRRAKRRNDAKRKTPPRDRRPSVAEAHLERRSDWAAWLAARRDDRLASLLARSSTAEIAEDAVLVQGNLDDAEAEELKPVAMSSIPTYRDELAHAIDQLREGLSKIDPVIVMANTGFRYGIVFGDFFEPTAETSEAKVEFVAGLLTSVRCDPSVNGHLAIVETHAALSEVDEIFNIATLLNTAERIAADGPEAAYRYHARARHLTVRGTGYPQHGLDLARRIYGGYSMVMQETLGFDLETLVSIEDGIMRSLTDRLNDVGETAISETENHAADVLAQFASKEEEGLPDLSLEDVRERILYWELYPQLPDAMSFSAAELARMTNVDEPTVERVLERLALPLGEGDGTYDSPFRTSPLPARPFVSWQGKYLLPAPGIIGREYPTLIERHLGQPSKNFHKIRARVVDEYAVELLASLFPGCRAYGRLFYTPPGGDELETDGLVLWDDVALVVEGKGTALGTTVERGDVARLRNDIAKTIEHAWEQGKRVRDELLSGGGVEFRTESGETIRVEPGEITTVFVINPTIHLMSDHAPQLARLRHLDLFRSGEYPFSVFINDLRIIAEALAGPSEFLTYLAWRAKLPLGETVLVSDEIDLLGTFLQRGQVSRRLVLDPGSFVVVNGSTVDFDDFYMAEATGNTRARRPKMSSIPPIRRFVERVEHQRPEGWRNAVEVVLELSFPELVLTKVVLDHMSRVELEEQHFLAMPPSALPIAEGEFALDEAPSIGFVVMGHRVARERAWERSRGEMQDVQRVVFLRVSTRGTLYIDWALDQGIPPVTATALDPAIAAPARTRTERRGPEPQSAHELSAHGTTLERMVDSHRVTAALADDEDVKGR